MPIYSLFWCFSPCFVDKISNIYIESRYIGKFEKIDIDKAILKNIDNDKGILQNIDIDKAILKNIDIDKEILQNIEKEIL